MLSDLQLGEFIYEQPATGDIEYIFKHALTQEVAYNSLLVERRKQIHEQAAQAIETLFAANLPDHYADLARHYVRSGNGPQAVNYLDLAAQQSMARSAYSEANTQLMAALELLRTLPQNSERDRGEIALVLGLAMCLGVGADSRGSRGLETSLSMLERALQLSEKVGDEFNRLKILEFLTINYSILPDHLRRARALNEELLTIGEHLKDSDLVGWARSWLGWLSMHEGKFPAAMRELDQAYKLSAIPSLARRVRPINWRLHSRAFSSLAFWVSGYPKGAVARAREAIAVARDIAAAPADLIFALWWSGNLQLLLKDSTNARAFSDEAMRLIAEHGLPGLTRAQIPQEAWTLVQLGQIETGLSEMLRYKTDVVELGAVFATWLFLGLANAYLANGRASEGIGPMDEGLGLCRSSGVRMLESEIHRLKGELLLSDDNHEAAAQCFYDAISLARSQSAKSWELRATVSLARLLTKQGRREEAHRMLAEIYSWFTEGFDTADLKDAKALLNELAG
jgi:adenylate cyclase